MIYTVLQAPYLCSPFAFVAVVNNRMVRVLVSFLALLQQTSTGLFRHDCPSIAQLLEFPQKSGTINIIEQIGGQYRILGPLLLNDNTGTITDDIEREFTKKAFDINLEILKRWIRGSGITPVTWETLIEKLKSIRLTELARKMEKILPSLL